MIPKKWMLRMIAEEVNTKKVTVKFHNKKVVYNKDKDSIEVKNV